MVVPTVDDAFSGAERVSDADFILRETAEISEARHLGGVNRLQAGDTQHLSRIRKRNVSDSTDVLRSVMRACRSVPSHFASSAVLLC